MRNISFMLTIPQFRARTKTVTRRNGWAFLKPGDLLMGCEKCQGLGKGGELVKLGAIRVKDVRRERLGLITLDDCIREGFPEMSPPQFVEMFCKTHKGVTRQTIITRIQFEYVDAKRLASGEG